ncbi:MAG: DNA-directed RNA polymerase subunit B'' [Candidatus Micrarchaeota archaeon]|nr:DNA-directed RNA polymerase subunit B'' [Candidatus Micrarchaeota archaeon]
MPSSTILESYLNTNPLVQHQVESFNRFLDTGIQNVINRKNIIEPSIEGFALRLGKVRLDKASVIEADGSRRPIMPNETRLRNLTYAAPIFIEVVPIIRGIEKSASFGEVFVGELPIMAKSNLCYTKNASTAQLIENGDDPDDPGGYFIIKGVERVLIGLEDIAANRIITTKKKGGDKVSSVVFSTAPGFRARCVVTRNQNGLFVIDFPTTTKSINFVLLLRALGVKPTDMLEYADDLLQFKNDMMLNLDINGEFREMSQSEALIELGKLAAPGQAKEYQQRRAETQIDNYLLPHIGETPEDRFQKGKYLIQMARKSTVIANKMAKEDDKDHYANKRVKFAGELMEELFAYAFRFFTKEVKYQIERTSARGRKLSIQSIINPDTITERIAYAMGTGTWVAGQTGVSQVLDRTNIISTYTHLRRVKSPLAKKHPHFKARDVHGTQWGKICPSETPEGQEVGLTKYLALMAKVTVGAEEKLTEAKIKELSKIEPL